MDVIETSMGKSKTECGLRITMRKNLPKTLDQLIFYKYLVSVRKFTKYLVNVHKFSKFLAPKRRKTLYSY